MFDGIGSGIGWAWNSVIKPIFDSIGNTVKWVGDRFTDVWNGVTGFVTGAQSTFQKISNVFKGVIQGAMNFLIDLINTPINVLNAVIGVVKKLPFTDWLQPVGLISHITLAEGGIVNKATPAIFGEAGPEAALPLSKLPEIMASTIRLISPPASASQIYNNAIAYNNANQGATYQTNHFGLTLQTQQQSQGVMLDFSRMMARAG